MDRDGNRDIESFTQKLNNLYNPQLMVDSILRGLAAGGSRFVFSETLIKEMHATALNKLLGEAGTYRKIPVSITNSPHTPPNWIEVPALMQTCCLYVNNELQNLNLLQLSAFVLWRLNWIHPFKNGNGRTARAASYLVLCAKHGKALPPKNTVMQQMVSLKPQHDQLLRHADVTYATTQDIPMAINPLAEFMGGLLKNQLKTSFEM